MHCHEERNHQGLDGQFIVPPANLNRPGPIVCRERLGRSATLQSPQRGLKRHDRVFVHNAVKNRANAQTSCAAEFLHWQIDDCNVAWGHIDLAGPSMLEDRGTGLAWR
jgi:hypothetical protein